MLVNFVDTFWYILSMAVMVFLFLVMLFLLYKCKKNIRLLKNARMPQKYEDDIIQLKKQKEWIIFAILIVCLLFVGGVGEHFKYVIKDEFAWSVEERKSIADSTFNVVERREDVDIELYEERLHINWFFDEFESEDEEVTQDILEGYDKKLKNIFQIVPNEESSIRMSNVNNKIKEKKTEFEKIITCDPSDLTSEELWDGFILGEDVVKVYYNSKNIFQMAVLAENAHEHAIQNNQDINTTIIYSAGAIEKFEKFVQFIDRNAGENTKVSVDMVCFRSAKMLYRDSEKYVGKNNKMAKHCGVYSYSCFKLSEEMVGYDDPNYLLYLYYRGVSCLNIIQFIDNEDLCKKICNEELDKWKKLEEAFGEDYVLKYNVENKSQDRIVEVRNMLEIHTK